MGFRITNALKGAIASLFLLAAPALAQVPDPFARELAQRLVQAEQAGAEQGYARAAGPFAGGLEQGGARGFPVTLRAGQSYRIVGVCDGRCRDLDLRLIDASGRIVAREEPAGAASVIELRPVVTGVYTIEARMAQCTAAGECFYAFNIYSR